MIAGYCKRLNLVRNGSLFDRRGHDRAASAKHCWADRAGQLAGHPNWHDGLL